MSILKEIAQALNGSQRPLRDNRCGSTFEIAQKNNVVIVYGASDDLVEFRGAIDDEGSCYEGGTVLIDKYGIIPVCKDGSFRGEFDNISECRELVKRFDNAVHITAIWCPKDEDDKVYASWAYEVSWAFNDKIQYETFDVLVMDDGELYCRGVVLQLPDNHHAVK